MSFDPTSLLTALGLGGYTAAAIPLLMCLGYIVTWIAPLIPAPGPNASGFVTFLYAVVQKIAGNVGLAKNHSQVIAEQTNAALTGAKP